MQTALWITAVGSAVLFGSIAGLVGLMYLLTARWLFPRDERPARPVRPRKRMRRFRRRAGVERAGVEPAVQHGLPESNVPDVEEDERRRRAVALAVAIACTATETDQIPLMSEGPSDWRLLHRARQLSAPAVRRKARQ